MAGEEEERMKTTLSSDEKAELLRGVELFEGIGPEALAMIAERAIEVEYPADRTIVRQGEIGTGFFLLVSGRGRVIQDGEQIATMGPGDFFGELSLLDQRPRIAHVIADEETVCLAIASWDFERLLEEQPKLTLSILRGVARRLRAASEHHRH